METLYQSLLKYNDSKITALYFENKKYSFKQLLINVRKMVTYLKEKGIKKNDIVTIVLPNVPVTVYLFYALDAIGAIQNIVHPLTPINQIINTMQETNSKHAIVLETLYKDNKEIFEKSSNYFFFVNPMHDKSLLMRNVFYLKYKKVKEDNHLFSLDRFRKYHEANQIENRNAFEDSIYLHSGGTTGTPKVIALSDASINNLAAKVDGIIPLSIKGKSMLAVLPSFHGFGLGMGIHAPLYNQAASALMVKFNSKKVIKWINQNKVNLIIGVPLLYQKLMKYESFIKAKLTNLQYCFVGGDNVSPTLIERFNNLMKENNSSAMLLEGYGLTETVTVCNVNTKENFKIKSVGKPLNDITVKILDESLNELKANEIGEVFIHSNTIMNGYLHDKKATENALININGIKYVKTGDLGYLDEDGFLFLKGRMKRVFKISGINVYPSEVEKIATELESVYDASLEYFDNGKPHLVLFVIKHHNETKEENIIKDEIMKVLNEKVFKYALPSKIIFMKDFPKTNVGKIDHKAFKEEM